MEVRASFLKICGVVLLLFFAAYVSAATMLDSYVQFRKLEQRVPGESRLDQDMRIQNAYDTFFRPAQMRVHQSSDDDLEVLLRAATSVSGYIDSENIVRDAETDLRELMSRGHTLDRDVLDVYKALVKHRKFAEAERMFDEHHVEGMERVPKIIDRASSVAQTRTEYQIQSEKYGLIHQSAKVPRTGILVIAHPNCHFTVAAARAIHGDSVLGPIFRSHSKWLAPADAYLDIPAFQEWNKQHPEATMSVAYRNSDWQVVNEWATPSFFFFRDGRLMKEITGWPPEGGAQAFGDALRSLGLIAPGDSLHLSQESSSAATPAVTTSSADERPGEDVRRIGDQRTIDIGTARIKSHEDLDAYLQRTPMSDSPLRALSPVDRQLFLSGLVFSKDGLVSFPFTDLEGLSATQAYEILALFGWQRVVPLIEGVRTESPLDKLIMGTSSN